MTRRGRGPRDPQHSPIHSTHLRESGWQFADGTRVATFEMQVVDSLNPELVPDSQANAAIDLQRPCASARAERSVPDEHFERRAAPRLPGRNGAARPLRTGWGRVT